MAQATGSEQWESGSGDDGKQGKGTGKTSGKPSGKGKGKGSDTTAMGKGTSLIHVMTVVAIQPGSILTLLTEPLVGATIPGMKLEQP